MQVTTMRTSNLINNLLMDVKNVAQGKLFSMDLILFSNSWICLCRYELQITGDGISNQQTNPEVIVDVNRPSSLLNEQMFALKTITSKLKNAYNGLDVEWIDIGELGYRKKGVQHKPLHISFQLLCFPLQFTSLYYSPSVV